jgi:transposase-like protein
MNIDDLGINIKKVKCPDCGQEQPMLRKPKSIREALFGGWTCEKCGCKMNKFGEKRSK